MNVLYFCVYYLVLLMEYLDDSPVRAHHILVWTRRDPILFKVLQYVNERGMRNEKINQGEMSCLCTKAV